MEDWEGADAVFDRVREGAARVAGEEVRGAVGGGGVGEQGGEVAGDMWEGGGGGEEMDGQEKLFEEEEGERWSSGDCRPRTTYLCWKLLQADHTLSCSLEGVSLRLWSEGTTSATSLDLPLPRSCPQSSLTQPFSLRRQRVASSSQSLASHNGTRTGCQAQPQGFGSGLASQRDIGLSSG